MQEPYRVIIFSVSLSACLSACHLMWCDNFFLIDFMFGAHAWYHERKTPMFFQHNYVSHSDVMSTLLISLFLHIICVIFRKVCLVSWQEDIYTFSARLHQSFSLWVTRRLIWIQAVCIYGTIVMLGGLRIMDNNSNEITFYNKVICRTLFDCVSSFSNP